MFKQNFMSLAVGTVLTVGSATASAFALPNPLYGVRDAGQGVSSLSQAQPADFQRDAALGFLAIDGGDKVAAKGSGRRKPRVPGGSGCDDPEDVIEHPECAGNAPSSDDQLARRKPRVPGGSGCDDAEDIIEHPECRLGALPQDKQFVAREASEGPRGADNERPGDRQRRGGRG